jgi:hypothetical protein
MQVGDLQQALGYALEAIPVMEALGATEDVAQLRAVLAVSAMAEGRYAEAAAIFDDIEDDGGIFGAAIIVRCGRPELDLAAGRIEDGLRAYRNAVQALGNSPIPGIGLSLGYEPWTLFPMAAALSAHVRHGHLDDGRSLRSGLVSKVPVALGEDVGFLDYPVVGAMVFALAEWELATATAPADLARAVRLLVCADVFGYNRQLPSLSWAPGLAMAEAALPGEVARVRAALGDRKGPDLRDEVRELVVQLT